MADVSDSSKYETIKDNIKNKINEMIPILIDNTDFYLKKKIIFAYIDDVKPNNINQFKLMDDLVELSKLLHTSNNSNLKTDILRLKEQLLEKALMNSLLVKETNNAEQKAEEQQATVEKNLKENLEEIVTLVEANNKGYMFGRKDTKIEQAIYNLKKFINSVKMNDKMQVDSLLVPILIITLKNNIKNSDKINREKKNGLIAKIDALFTVNGGKKSKKLPKKEILGKMRCIYKIPGDRKEYLKHKGKLITVKEYKELMKPKKKEAKPKKVKKTKSKK